MKVKELKRLLSQMDDDLDVKIKFGVHPNQFREPSFSIEYVEKKEVKVEGNSYSLCSTGKYESLLSL